MPATLTDNEESQLKQTIEMFEFICESSPNDVQSLDILKEAYFKLNREADVVRTSKRIASAYVGLGQLSSAILEYETILQRFPDDQTVLKALADIENRATNIAAPPLAESLMADRSPPPLRPRGLDGKPAQAAVEDGRGLMQKHFVEGKLIAASDFDACWPAPKLDEPPRSVVEPFIHTLAEKQLYPLDKSLKLLCERTGLGYLGMDKYDVDVDLARSFSRDLCFRWCVLPFDRMSKSVFVATANPFNKQALLDLEKAAQGKGGKTRFLWYLAPPADIIKVLKKLFR